MAPEVRWSQGVGGCRAGCLAGRRKRGATVTGKYYWKAGSSAAFGGSHFMAEKIAEQGDGTTLQGSVVQLRKPQPQLRVLPMSSSNIHVACSCLQGRSPRSRSPPYPSSMVHITPFHNPTPKTPCLPPLVTSQLADHSSGRQGRELRDESPSLALASAVPPSRHFFLPPNMTVGSWDPGTEKGQWWKNG